MLYFTLGLMGIVLIVANLSVRRSSAPKPTVIAVCVSLTFLSCIMFGFAVPAFSGLICLFVVLEMRRSRFLPLSIVVFLVVFGLACIPGIRQKRQYEEYRAEFPFESMEERLSNAKPIANPTKWKDYLFETQIEEDVASSGASIRSRYLNFLHDSAFSSFVNSPGFGVFWRSDVEVSRKGLTFNLRDDCEIAQPIPSAVKLGVIDEKNPVLKPDKSKLHALHREGVSDFVNPVGWGYFKDRAHVAGFRPHQFSKVPKEENSTLRVASIELIGWLHGDPAVYVSENLPSMKKLRGAPTRPLDAIEEEGFGKLKGGDDLFIKTQNGTMRMLGAIRATNRCIHCHDGERGDLLGAFSYQLR